MPLDLLYRYQTTEFVACQFAMGWILDCKRMALN